MEIHCHPTTKSVIIFENRCNPIVSAQRERLPTPEKKEKKTTKDTKDTRKVSVQRDRLPTPEEEE